jgi:hypothetical protein
VSCRLSWGVPSSRVHPGRMDACAPARLGGHRGSPRDRRGVGPACRGRRLRGGGRLRRGGPSGRPGRSARGDVVARLGPGCRGGRAGGGWARRVRRHRSGVGVHSGLRYHWGSPRRRCRVGVCCRWGRRARAGAAARWSRGGRGRLRCRGGAGARPWVPRTAPWWRRVRTGGVGPRRSPEHRTAPAHVGGLRLRWERRPGSPSRGCFGARTVNRPDGRLREVARPTWRTRSDVGCAGVPVGTRSRRRSGPGLPGMAIGPARREARRHAGRCRPRPCGADARTRHRGQGRAVRTASRRGAARWR